MQPGSIPTKDLPIYMDAWTLYVHDDPGFQFEYPLIYRDASWCGVQESKLETGGIALSVGSRIVVVVEQRDALSVEDYISELMAGASSIEIYPTPVASHDGYLVFSRYGGLGRLEQIYVVDIGQLRISMGITPPWLCDYPELGISEPGAFQRIVDTISLSQ